jgi:hypothetical protein
MAMLMKEPNYSPVNSPTSIDKSKRNSRSFDLTPSSSIDIPTTKHQRSTSADGVNAVEVLTQKNIGNQSMPSQNTEDSLSAVLPPSSPTSNQSTTTSLLFNFGLKKASSTTPSSRKQSICYIQKVKKEKKKKISFFVVYIESSL